MYKVIYQKHDGKVVGCYPFEYVEKTEYFIMDSEGYELNVDETEEGAYPKTFLVESARFFYNKETCEAVDFETIPPYDKNQYLVYQDGKFIVETNSMSLIAELKAKLTATDYQAIKYAEGQMSEEEYAPIKAQRQSWRDKINELEEVK